MFVSTMARMFMDDMNLGVDKNLVITACILCGCKKKKDATDIETIRSYAKNGANYLATLGFDKRFCKICEEVDSLIAEEKEHKIEICFMIEKIKRDLKEIVLHQKEINRIWKNND